MGSLLIDREVPSFDGGVAHIWIETAAPADASSERLAGTRVDGIVHRWGQPQKIPFEIECSVARRGRANLRAWVDIEGRGAAAQGDLFSTEAVPIAAGQAIIRVEDPTATERGRGQ